MMIDWLLFYQYYSDSFNWLYPAARFYIRPCHLWPNFVQANYQAGSQSRRCGQILFTKDLHCCHF